MSIVEHEFLELTRNLDPEAFWAENDQCTGFTTEKPRCALAFSPDDHWIFEFESVPSTLRYYRDKPYRDSLHRAVNEITARYVGKRFFDEDTWEHQPKRIENLFGAEFAYREGGTPWFVPAARTPDELHRILDSVERTEIRSWALPDAFVAEWEQRAGEGRARAALGTGSRGPATVMTSIVDPSHLFLWFYDHPELMVRFRDLLAAKMVELNRVLREFSGTSRPGWWITDDNCALFNPELYAEYCAPVLQTVMNEFAPHDADPPATRYQHSDSAMGHLLDQQYALGIRAVNYGPEVDPGLIRHSMPDAYIRGQLPPMVLRNGSPEEIRAKVSYDFRSAGASGGLLITTAGSLAAGTGVGRMRYLMQVVGEECRYGA